MVQPINRAAPIRKVARGNDPIRIEFHVLISVACIAGYPADELPVAIPDIKFLAVPVPPDQEFRRHCDAADMIRYIELKLKLQSTLAPPLNDAAALRTILGHWHP